MAEACANQCNITKSSERGARQAELAYCRVWLSIRLVGEMVECRNREAGDVESALRVRL